MIYLLKIVIFHGYVSLPERNTHWSSAPISKDIGERPMAAIAEHTAADVHLLKDGRMAAGRGLLGLGSWEKSKKGWGWSSKPVVEVELYRKSEKTWETMMRNSEKMNIG